MNVITNGPSYFVRKPFLASNKTYEWHNPLQIIPRTLHKWSDDNHSVYVCELVGTSSFEIVQWFIYNEENMVWAKENVVFGQQLTVAVVAYTFGTPKGLVI